jgi:hypothetical protein
MMSAALNVADQATDAPQPDRGEERREIQAVSDERLAGPGQAMNMNAWPQLLVARPAFSIAR